MTKYYKNIFVATILAFFITSCADKKDSKPVLSVSIEPQKYFLEQIVGDKYAIHTVIPNGSNPESFDPSPAQMVALGKSKAYFKVGFLGFENSWIDNIKKNNPELIISDCSENIQLHECEDHGHEHDGHSHEGPDPHIWSSPNTAAIMAKNMYNSLITIDPSNKELYRENHDKLQQQFQQTDSIIRSYIAKAPSKSFIIYHPALSYFAEKYGLKQLSIEFEGKNPSPAQIKQLIDIAKAEDVKVVFIQEEFDKKNTETIASEIGGKVLSINLLSYDWQNEMIKIAKALALEE